MTRATVARAAAIAIAVVAAIDPAFTRSRPVPVPVSLVHATGAEPFAQRVRRALGDEFHVIDGLSPHSQAVILLRSSGAAPPDAPETGRLFIVDDPSPAPAVRIQALDAPRAALDGRAVTVTVTIDAASGGGPVRTVLRAGDRLAASDERPIDDAGGRIVVPLRFVPDGAGLGPIRVDVTSGATTVSADTALRVEDRKLRVLFVDPRPSWTSTFVRRALEQDPAFEIAAEVATSRGVTSSAGPAWRYDTDAGRDAIDAVVVGTPSAVSRGALQHLDAFARLRGGALVLLGDPDAAGTLRQLTGIEGWRRRTFGTPVIAAAPHGSFPLSEALLPSASALPAAPLATLDGGRDLLVQEIPAGAGRIIVSGALDAWRYRGADGSAFAAFWRGVIGEAALASAPPISVTLTPQRASPGDFVHAEVVVRGAKHGEAIAVEAVVESGGAAEALRLWPASAPGVFTARFRAPGRAGMALVKVKAGPEARDHAAPAALLVAPTDHVIAAPAAMAALLAATHGGAYVPDGDTGSLRAALREAFPAHHAPVTTHPMRYAGWLLPFTLLLGYEWRWRRRRGLK